jgi:hypothetical protein
MSQVELTLALSRYDHTEDQVTGRVPRGYCSPLPMR